MELLFLTFHSIIIIKYLAEEPMEVKLTNTRKRGTQTLELDFSYRKISYQLRKELIQLVIKEGSSVYRASKLLKINNSTAKAIIRKFRKDGTIYMRKKEIQNLCCPQQGAVNQTENQEHEQQVEEQEQCNQEALQEQPPFFYFYNLGLQNCFGYPTYSFATFY